MSPSSSSSSSLHRGRRTSSLRACTVALVAAVAVAVAVHSTVAAPQSNGGPTMTIAGQQCQCKPFYHCDMKDTVFVPYGSNDLDCESTDTVKFVCCRAMDDSPILPVTNPSKISSCGIGNPNTNSGQFPWMAGILKTITNGETGRKIENIVQCGGSLIHPRVVLTAAHCVNGMDVKSLKIRVGVWQTQLDSIEVESHEDRDVSKIVYHPYFNNITLFYDIALIKLEVEIALLYPYFNVVCIPDYEAKINYNPQSCVSTGLWNKNENDSSRQYQYVFKKLDFSLVPNDVCQQQLRTTGLGSDFILHESFNCAGGVQGVDMCKGDGGGPLMCSMLENPKKYIQVGIVSWGTGCYAKNVPGVYSSLVDNSQWINTELKKMITSQ